MGKGGHLETRVGSVMLVRVNRCHLPGRRALGCDCPFSHALREHRRLLVLLDLRMVGLDIAMAAPAKSCRVCHCPHLLPSLHFPRYYLSLQAGFKPAQVVVVTSVLASVVIK